MPSMDLKRLSVEKIRSHIFKHIACLFVFVSKQHNTQLDGIITSFEWNRNEDVKEGESDGGTIATFHPLRYNNIALNQCLRFRHINITSLSDYLCSKHANSIARTLPMADTFPLHNS